MLDEARGSAREFDLDAESLGRFVAALGPVAVIDLETTGLSNDPAAEILEFGAVLLDPPDLRVTTLHSLLRPRTAIPPAIERITGIGDADVADAPSLGEIAPEIEARLAGRTLIAHNADFERSFLSRFVSQSLESALYLDSQDLLSLTHPDAPDMRLESFSRALLGKEEGHRALEDALDTIRVLSHVGSGATANESRYGAARVALERYAPGSPWLALLGKGKFGSRHESAQFVEIGETRESPVPFDEDAIASVLRDEARGARYFPGYRVREEQVELAQHFARNLTRGRVLLLEGGTGVGKSLAYLAAAIPFAVESVESNTAEPVVVATRTKLLQDQLLAKDIGAAARFLGYPGLRALSIKGRANYVCERRLAGVLEEGMAPRIFEEDRMAYAVLSACARTRSYGEVGSVPSALLRRYPPLYDALRRSVAARAEHCSREQCAHQRDCPFGMRRAALARAHLIIANHDLLLRWPPDYPKFSHVIVDEVHELADVADEVYATTVSPEGVLERLDDVFGRPGEAKRKGKALPGKKRRELASDASAWRRGIQQDLTALGRELYRQASEFGEVQVPEPPGPAFEVAAELAESAAARMETVADVIEDSILEILDEPQAQILTATNEALIAAAAALRNALTGAGEDAVASFENLDPPYDRWRLSLRSVSPADAFHTAFMEQLQSFAGVSASLFVDGDAFAALGNLEIETRERSRLDRVSLPSPFPYEDHMRVLALRGGGDLVETTAQVVAQIATLLQGRTLGLFTSLRRMHDVAEILARSLREERLEVLVPRRASDDPAALVERFARGGSGVLLGARKFWQGLDIPGDDLQAVVIEKLPFEVPTELRRRREQRLREQGVDVFGRYALGKMILNLKQMIGRLIRSEEDRGIAIIVEGRPDRPYFSKLDNATPPGTGVQLVEARDIPRILAELGIGPAAREGKTHV